MSMMPVRFCMAAITLMAVLSFAGCRERGAVPSVADDPYLKAPAHVSYNIKVNFHEDARTKAILRSSVARLFEDRQETTLGDTVIVDFYSLTSGRRIARLTADSAIIDDRTKAMTAIGNVYVWSDSSHTSLATPRLLWDSQTSMLSSSEDVEIISPTEHIEGRGFISDQYLTNYRIFNVRGVHKQ